MLATAFMTSTVAYTLFVIVMISLDRALYPIVGNRMPSMSAVGIQRVICTFASDRTQKWRVGHWAQSHLTLPQRPPNAHETPRPLPTLSTWTSSAAPSQNRARRRSGRSSPSPAVSSSSTPSSTRPTWAQTPASPSCKRCACTSQTPSHPFAKMRSEGGGDCLRRLQGDRYGDVYAKGARAPCACERNHQGP